MADPRALVEQAWAELDIGAAMADLARLTEFDRYQASDGIAAAARFVADRAQAVGLADVEILEFPADGSVLWGTYEAPMPWTPRSASLGVAGGTTVVDYPADAFGLALHSASVPLGRAPLTMSPRAGAIVLVDGYPNIGELVASRAVGFAAAVRPDTGAAGRIELPPRTPLAGFSLTAAQYAHLSRAAAAQRDAVVRVDVDTSPRTFPVVTARTPGRGEGPEILVVAHLCHPAPSAGDNASGVAATLAIGGWLARQGMARRVRFVWGPEFTGLAAWASRQATMPEFAINLDMVGQNPALCGGPLIVERTPSYARHPVDAVVEYCLRSLPQSQRSYSGAVGCDTFVYKATPFVGASDHALLADRAVGVPAVQIGHWPDRFNHSSADTLDKIDPVELRRAATAVAATVAAFASTGDRTAIDAIAARHDLHARADCLPDPGAPATSPDGWIDPHAGDQAANRLTAWTGWAYHENGLKRMWPGPFNLRALLAACPDEPRRELESLLAERGRGYALIMALAQAIDGATPWPQVVVRAAHEAGLPISYAFADTVREALTASGWAA